jgi:hypothetical protein
MDDLKLFLRGRVGVSGVLRSESVREDVGGVFADKQKEAGDCVVMVMVMVMWRRWDPTSACRACARRCFSMERRRRRGLGGGGQAEEVRLRNCGREGES